MSRLEAAAQLGSGKVAGLAMYEAPYNDDPEARRPWSRYLDQLAEQIEGMRQSPWWPALEALGPTLAMTTRAYWAAMAHCPPSAWPGSTFGHW